MSNRTFVFDLDGVIYRGDQPLLGAADTIHSLRQRGHQVYFFTNNSTELRSAYVEKLSGMGIPADEGRIMTSAYAAALYLGQRGGEGKRTLVLGEKGICGELTAIGVELTDDGLGGRVDYVVVGLDRRFTYDKLLRAQQAILKGAKLIATNRDATFPLADGLVAPGGGAMVAAVEVSSGARAVVMGKPETPAMCEVLRLAGASPAHAVVVGDRLDTDILAGRRIGATTVLVLTGVTGEEDLSSAPPEMKPDLVARSLPDMLDKLGSVGLVESRLRYHLF